ncbi:MAG: Hsp20/alpha crystallin family protein [Synergistaceae bacterium]|nr:Hsp20/alpha crystallin family protein [Synergistaceae bacterium]
MVGLVPFNRRSKDVAASTGFGDFYNVLDDFFSNDWPFRRSLANDTFKVDVQDNDNEYLIEAEMPGVDKKDINVALDEGKLLISVTRDEKTEEKNKNFIHRERRQVSMSRSIYLADAKNEGIKAKLENGLLRITVPKEEKPGTTTIAIDVE